MRYSPSTMKSAAAKAASRSAGEVFCIKKSLEGVGRVVFWVVAVPDDFGFVAGCTCFGVFDGEDAGEYFVGDVDGGDGGVQGRFVRMG